MKLISRLTISTLLGLCTTAYANSTGNVMVEVSSVYCQPAHAVNFNETFKVGQRYAIDQDLASQLPRVNNKLVLRDKIRTGSRYRSGRPPCPIGSILIAEFIKR